MKKLNLLLAGVFWVSASLYAQIQVPAIIGDHMVLQQNQANPIWGWDTPGTRITVTFAGQSYSATAGADGKWTVKLAAAPANAKPQTLIIQGTSKREIQDVLVGEVWMCSGQSNMGFVAGQDTKGDLEIAASRYPNIRLMKVPLRGTQDLQTDFKGEWRTATPETVRGFSAVGFFFGRYLHQVLDVPVGLVDNAWGGSSAEAWVRRQSLEQDPRFERLMESTRKREADLQSDEGKAKFEQQLAKWREASEKARAERKPAPRRPEDWLANQHRPGNIFAGTVYPTLGYGLRGVIWYQGESNAGRAQEYRDLFPYMIQQWRKEWGQGDFPFYWVQLADFKPEKPEPGESDWAELREAQTMTLKLPNTGQAVIIDLGEANDIHPRNKLDVAARLVRWALAKDYGMKLAYRSPEYKGMTVSGNRATVTFDCFGSTLRTFDVAEVKGFVVCGADKLWHWASAKVSGPDKVEVWSDEVDAPVAVRYAWADNPVCNLRSAECLPVTPFRTDDFPMITAPR